MKTIEVSAKSLDEAKTKALLELGASSDSVKFEVIEEGTKGLLGLFGKEAKVRATLIEEEDEVIAPKKAEASKKTEEPKKNDAPKKADAPKKEAKPEKKKEEKPQQKAEAKSEKKQEEKPAKQEMPKEFVTATGETVVFDDSLEKRIREANARREKNGGKGSEGKKERRDDKRPVEKKEAPEAVSYEIPADAEEVQVRLKAFLSEVLTAMGVNATITTDFSEEGILEADIESADEVPEGADSGMGVIIGKRGNTLDSLQYLATLVLNKGRADHLHIKLDTEGYRKRRQETLENLARNTARKVKKNGRRIMLDPMNPYERRIIHSVLQSERGIETYSEGEEPYRKVVIAPTRNR